MKKYTIKNIRDIYNLPKEHFKEFLQDLILSYETFYTLKQQNKKLQIKNKMIFIPDGKHNVTIKLNKGIIIQLKSKNKEE